MKRIIRGALLCAAIVTAGIVSAQKSKDMSVARGLNTFSSIVKELEMNYVDTINSETAFKGAIDAMLQTVDPYTVYYPKEDREDISQMTTGEYAGIGALLLYKDGGTYVSEPFENSPAYKGGLRAGDRLLKVDTVDVSKFTVDKVSKLLRGRPDTQVRIRVQRPYVQDSIRNFTVTRAKIRNSSVPYAGVLPDSIGYIRITQFIEDTGKDVRAALDSFQATAPGLKGVIIDLRGNGGGLLEQAVDVASNFVPKGTEIVRTIGRDKDATKIYKTMRKPLYPDMPVAVLTDGGTASASEILAGAMQDLDRGVLVGTRSFGKGLVQTTRPLPYGGVLKVTVAKYYTPSGRLIQSLDYKHRNPDGSAARVPDSLTHAYKTLHGRTIRDGGGLQPDSTVNWKKVNRLVYNVVSDNWSWDFANKFKATHPTIPTADKFVITDSVYNEFKAFIDPKKFKYDSAMEEATEALRKVADEEGYINDETTAAFDSLKKLLTHNLDRDLDTHRKHIEEYLGGEIVSRYYFDRGRTQYGIRDDEGVDAARGILKDKALYKRILSGK
jgi:carboxyl-terminal processing protease